MDALSFAATMAATDENEQATWWSGDGVWETRVAEDSEDEPFRYEFTTAADGTVSIVRLDGEDKVDEGTASFDGDMLDAEVFGGQFSAEIHDDGATLVWSDGDEWSRVSTRRKAVAPRRRLLSKAGTAAVLNPAENLPTKPIVVASPVPAPSFPKAATPSFSFTPAPAAAVMPATSCQPVFSFSSSASKTAAPVFSFPDIPVTPAAVAPATLSAGIPTEGSGSIGDHRSAGNDQEEHVEDGSDAADACDDPLATADAETDEAVVPDSYEQQLKTLVHFYATYESAKSESECRAILDKRKGDADAMTALQFSKLCTKLSTKYGTNPMDMVNKASQQSSTTPSSDPERTSGLVLIDEGKALLSAGDKTGALSCFEEALAAFDGNRPKLEQRIAALKKTMTVAAATDPFPESEGYEHDHSDGEDDWDPTDQPGRLKDWVRTVVTTGSFLKLSQRLTGCLWCCSGRTI
jgi:hypothetical protein